MNVTLKINIIYLDFTTQRLVSKSILYKKIVHIDHLKYNKIKNINIIKNFNFENKVLQYIKNNKIYYRINLQHNGIYHPSWKQEKLLKNSDNLIYMYIPIDSLNYDSINYDIDSTIYNSDNCDNSDNYDNYDNSNNCDNSDNYELYINISIHDKIGIFNIIKNYNNSV